MSINNTRIGYYPPHDSVMLYRFEVGADGSKAIAEKRVVTNEFLTTIRDWLKDAPMSQNRIPNAIGRFRNWFTIRVLGRPDRAPNARTRWFRDSDGNTFIVSITTIPGTAVKEVANDAE